MLTPEEAWERIAERATSLESREVARRDALGRALSAPLAATVDVPAADVSAMDGYTLAGAAAAGDELPVAGVVAAGDAPGFALPAGAAARIMTGAPVPSGADTVVPVELTDGGRETVRFTADTPRGVNIRRRGEVLRRGDPLLPPGHLLTPGALALAATHGLATLPVHRRPRVAVLTTGDEVVAPDRVPAPGQLRDSHTDFLLAACRLAGVEAEPLGIAPDEPAELAARVRSGLAADVLLVCGGVSMGEFDLVEGVLAEAGCEVLFDAVALTPGKPLVTARSARGWVFGLPGNPASVMVCFWLFVRPLLDLLQGRPGRCWGDATEGVLAGALPGAKDRDRFLAAEVALGEGRPRVTPVVPKGSHDVAAYARGTALVRIRPGAPPAPPGASCEVMIVAG
ncbi:MAG: molybdopterin molybdotransferase MoeA [Thermoanaerobaculia bacterium]|nr:molybdopterin molybdotransferase MoeA [Thermoanaerobaculia bacterium]